MRGLWRALALAGVVVALAACGEPKQHNQGGGPAFSLGQNPAPPQRGPADVDGARILAADTEPGNWMTYGRTYNEQRFSPLDQAVETYITPSTTMGVASWPRVVSRS